MMITQQRYISFSENRKGMLKINKIENRRFLQPYDKLLKASLL